MKKFLVSASIVTLSAVTAMAADIPSMEAPAPIYSPTPMAYSWSGFYAGGHVGYAFAEEDGFVVGGQLGYNWQFNQFVVGAEADASWADLGESDSLASIRLRAGIPIDRLLVYGTGGVAFADFEDSSWVAGAGVEYAITDKLSAGLEYLHYDFDNANVVRARVNYKFGF